MSNKKGPALDELDPMAALLAKNSQETTILDEHFNEAKKNDSSLTQKYISNRKKSHTPDNSIGLGYRQSSSSSFHGTVVTKTGDSSVPKESVQQDADPVVVFDGHSSDTGDNEPIELGVRQPSFVSLHGQIIPKGADSLADLHTVIEEEPMEPEPIVEQEEEEDEEEEDDAQVKIVKHLQAKNANRWAAIGYEPPQNLIPLVRAKSHAVINGQSQALTRNGYTTTSLTKFYMNTDLNANSPIAAADIIEEEPEMTKSGTLLPPPSRRKRSGSDGMKIGEASASMEQMHLIIPGDNVSKSPVNTDSFGTNLPKSNVEEDKGTSSNLQEIDEMDELCENEEDNNEGMEEEEILAEEEIESGLFGNLNSIVTEPEESPVYQTILTGELPTLKNCGVVRVALKKYIKLCQKNNFHEELDYLQSLLEELPQSPAKKLTPPSTKTSSRPKCKSAGKQKQLPELETPAEMKSTPRASQKTTSSRSTPKQTQNSHKNLSPNASSVSSEFCQSSAPTTSTSLDMHLDRLLNEIDKEYNEAATELDKKWQSPEVVAKYSRPSADLLEMRSQARKLLRQRRQAEFERIQHDIKIQEEKESLISEKQLQADYEAADKKLKEHYAIKRDVLIKKFEHKKEMLSQLAMERNGPLDVKRPKMLNRQNDIEILQRMTDDVLRGRDVQDFNIDRIYSETHKKH
ncbi:hypothetical protein TVAG_446220 [Trichomonas vaginalis G3]|uniref:Uncharacterized protein n=1 Tax=Trichomonas vaginalis (strain ATCC PRA-98 / G3) TaxID=412133 RepID=A2FG45_TRIV3|nr:hypothetical protein TVAGG3_0004110 [Trichomonas vaginalis G3]EAX96122.1 hypothetical protein TVAG_446220 [Trichomonas vaginalis G3]KAI5538797.1 hypothetical protein TVAGG3_0004110 [Trichomonas vaginalis G3]|eukprot:XP_001309052.1 hypothetical protein [Trichomonas vaginalis G3]